MKKLLCLLAMLLGATLSSSAFIEPEGYYFLEDDVEYQDSILTLEIASRDTVCYSSCMVRVEVNPFNGLKVAGIDPDFLIQDRSGLQSVFVSAGRDTTWEKNQAYLENYYPKLNPGSCISCFSVKTEPNQKLAIKPIGKHKNVFIIRLKIDPRQSMEGDIHITISIYDVVDSLGKPVMVTAEDGKVSRYTQEVVGVIILKDKGKKIEILQSDR